MASATGFHRLVHLDLKGLPPSPKRLVELPELFASLGLTGILVEWEDTFPYARFPELKKAYTYSPATVREFLAQAKKHRLLVMPLLQTFGHMESLLSAKKYHYLREMPDDPRCLCPMHPDAINVMRRQIEDVVNIHREFGMDYFHLGGDEVYRLGACPKCGKFVGEHGKNRLYLHHMAPLFDHVNSFGVRPVIWHDMLRQWSDAEARPFAGKVDLMFWHYSANRPEIENFANPMDMKRFTKLGIGCWGASAYKGADGADVNLPVLANRVQNNLHWYDLARTHKLKGVALTAWSRYTTSIGCCEPLESCWEALAVCTRVLRTGKDNGNAEVKQARKKLFGSAEPDKVKPTKNKTLWNIYQICGEMDRWVDGFNRWHLRRFFWTCPSLWKEPRINPREVTDALKQTRTALDGLEPLVDRFRKAYKGLAVNSEIEYFVASRTVPVKALWNLADKELRRQVRKARNR